MTSGDEHRMDKHTELTNKINRLNKNVKLIMDTLNTLVEKLDVNHIEPKNDEEKEKEKNWIKSLLNDKWADPSVLGKANGNSTLICSTRAKSNN